MYLHLGVGKVIRTKDIVGIFDIDKTTHGAITKGFLSNAERACKVRTVGSDIPRSFTLTENGEVFISQISPAALASRVDRAEDAERRAGDAERCAGDAERRAGDAFEKAPPTPPAKL